MERPVDPWDLREPSPDLDGRDRAASVLTVANGWIGVRGAFEELHPDVGPATLMAAAHDDVPLQYPEPAFGQPDSSEHLVPVPDAWAVQLLVDRTPFDLRTAEVEQHERRLDLRRGVLHRSFRWTAPSGAEVEVRTRRVVSLTRRELVLTTYEVQALTDATVELRPFPCCGRAPGSAARPEPAPDRPDLLALRCHHDGHESWTVQSASRSGVRVVARGRFDVTGDVARDAGEHRTSLVAGLRAGQGLTLDLRVAYTAAEPEADASDDDVAALEERLLDDAGAVLDAASGADADALVAEHAAVLARVWDRADVEVVGDDAVQQAIRFSVLQVVQAAAGSADVGIRAKGLTGDGYDGHTFWDAEAFVIPVLDHVLPEGADAHLRWRHRTLPQAVDRARVLDLPGASYPWRTLTGRECSGYWPAGTAAVHVTADIADAAARHAALTGDEVFAREVARDVTVHAARFFLGLGRRDRQGGFHLDGVTGPDEYSALMDDNAFTNLMAQRVLRHAVRLSRRFPAEATAHGVDDGELRTWEETADAVVVPYDDELGVTQQAQGFTHLAAFDLTSVGEEDYPLHASVHYSRLYRRQVLKQADVVMAAWLAPDAFTTEQKRRDFDHYEPLTVRDSSLSAPAQAVVAAEIGYLDLAWAFTRETALIDLQDDGRPTEDGVHVAAHAGAWSALVVGFGGLRDDADGGLHLDPVLPPALQRLAFGLRSGASALRVEVDRTPTGEQVTYRLLEGPAVSVTHHGEAVHLTPEEPQDVRAAVPRSAGPAPHQPPGREPFDGR